MSASAPHIVWFRDDLRLSDNPALEHASRSASPLLAVYVFDVDGAVTRPLGGAARWWLHGSLEALAEGLARHDVRLVLLRGDPRKKLVELASDIGARAITWNRSPAAPGCASDDDLQSAFQAEGLEATSFKANLLFEAGEICTASGGIYRVFSPFWRAARQRPPERPLPAPKDLCGWAGKVEGDTLEEWGLRPSAPDWAGGLWKAWRPGERCARERLADFVDETMDDYANQRNMPGRAATSTLSPSLRFGEISPRQVWHAVTAAMQRGGAAERNGEKFLSEIGWREFAHQLLAEEPDLAGTNFNSAFDAFPWRDDQEAFAAWSGGRTGYPIVDAGMRELWATGWMHNRVRMITASFLTKHLLIDWRRGEKWFWDTLVDADPANNPAGWQWVAGSGADAAPYFRIFNPVLQGEKFDADGGYTRRWVPELADLPDRWLHHPWDAPEKVLDEAGVRLGETYPHQIVDHAAARARALDAYEAVKKNG